MVKRENCVHKFTNQIKNNINHHRRHYHYHNRTSNNLKRAAIIYLNEIGLEEIIKRLHKQITKVSSNPVRKKYRNNYGTRMEWMDVVINRDRFHEKKPVR